MSKSGRPSQSYVHECGDGGYVSATLSEAPEGTVFPPTFTLGRCLVCGVDPTVLRTVSPEYLAALDDDGDL